MLRRAIELDRSNLVREREDSDFQALVGTEGFQALAADFEETGEDPVESESGSSPSS